MRNKTVLHPAAYPRKSQAICATLCCGCVFGAEHPVIFDRITHRECAPLSTRILQLPLLI